MRKRPIIATRLATALGVLAAFMATSSQAQFGGPPDPNAAKAPTPRMSDGKPDLSGSWRSVGGGPQRVSGGMFRRCTPYQKPCMEWTNQSADYEFMAPSRLDPNHPLYKPKYWDKVQQLDEWTNKDDPVMTCLPLGIPRQGPPVRIFQTDKDITLFYRGGVDGGGGYSDFRMIPTDGRPHGPNDKYERSYTGMTVGHWEGDTLVLDSIGFTDETFLGRGGLFHSDRMHVVEKFTRTGNEMRYEVTVEDPEVLVKPWVMNPRILQISKRPTMIRERGACTDTEHKEVSTQIRH